MRILGIDPGLRLTGYGVIDFTSIRRSQVIDAGVVRLKTTASVAQRLVELEAALEQIITEHQPQIVAVEQLYAHYAHPRTAIIMGHARGVILLVAARHDCQLQELAANRIKQAVAGHGHAAKLQMQRAVQSIWNLPQLPQPPDVADALAIAYACGLDKATNRTVTKSTRTRRT
ncbi:MAG: crossover junction endodeoxyribonuclease RuvC [Phycisphaerales bacterium]|nr:crossover junction endodeoxyribonuclease RuvC [Phycisphaerales bacterium]